MNPLYDQRCSTFASDIFVLVVKGQKHENLITSVDSRDTPCVLWEYDSFSPQGSISKAFGNNGRYYFMSGLPKSSFQRGGGVVKSLLKFNKGFFVFFFMFSLLGLISAYAADIDIEGPTTVCPKNDSAHEFTANAYVFGTRNFVAGQKAGEGKNPRQAAGKPGSGKAG